MEGEIPYSELSNLSGVPIDPLQRIVRHAMLNKLFCEPRPGFVAHSETSALLAKDKTLASWLGHNYDEVFMSSYALSDALTKYPGSSEPGETAFAITFKQPKGIFRGLFTEQPWRAARFEEAMRALLQGSHDASHLVVGYDWSKHGDGLVVDVSNLSPVSVPFLLLTGFVLGQLGWRIFRVAKRPCGAVLSSTSVHCPGHGELQC